jgi:uncharacterized protein YjgD (DUF1641 family)
MTNEEIAKQLLEIQGKLDVITEEMAARKRQRQEMQELKDDLSAIAKDVFQTAVVELEDVAPFVNTGDFLHLIKKILRNTNAISAAISKFEGTIDFVEDFKPIGNDMFCGVLHKLDELENKGYFRLTRELAGAIDNALSQLSEEDIRRLGEKIVQLAGVVKILANSNLIPAVVEAANAIKDEAPEKYDGFGPWGAYKELRRPEMRRAVGMSMEFLKTLVTESKNSNHTQGDE